MSGSAVVFAGAGAAERIGGVRSQGSSRIAMEMCMADMDCVMGNERV